MVRLWSIVIYIAISILTEYTTSCDAFFVAPTRSSNGCFKKSSIDNVLCTYCNTRESTKLKNRNIRIAAKKQQESGDSETIEGAFSTVTRRDVLALTVAALVALPSAARAIDGADDSRGLEQLALGEGRWTSRGEAFSDSVPSLVPASFVTYLSRFLIRYDEGVSAWWAENVRAYSLLSSDDQRNKSGKAFGSLAMSVQNAVDRFLDATLPASSPPKAKFANLATIFLEKYDKDEESKRQISLLFAMLPEEYQPEILRSLAKRNGGKQTTSNTESPKSLPMSFTEDLAALLPEEFQSEIIGNTNAVTIMPPLNLYEIGIDDEFGKSAVATEFGPLASTPLKRQVEYTPDIYTLFGVCGAAGCALTHTTVIPLDVVKTRMQTNPGEYDNIVDGALSIARDEGPMALALGAQATIAGYLWYGLSVYPSYTFFKTFIGKTLLSPEIAMLHVNDVALVSGALAAVIASLLLTPLEAARIRTVADPDTYRSLGLFGTLGVIANENPSNGLKTLYAGLPSLLTRQVIFGSVKFLAFERASETILTSFPVLRDAVWTSLGVSLVAGGFAGVLSSVVSQPADSVLTYVARQSEGEGNFGFIEGCTLMVEKEGAGSLFRGLGSRCVWAGSIIAGQFLLYDVFRSLIGISGEDLSQVFEVVIQG
eukprot:CAMPEP_0198297416 /NCGR_PEP_ID=MMETSP1449-20131203/36799_1 /TAXON_ID=420275 /ORGANISM="Attheya septentrionalis, Strain CCMP2084" /LENGTH=653 /DNA_ID=CAMNT_0043998335 /DNA_START=228 /DNA_END=2189 /DNA_ORIENTATION=+